MTAKPNTTTISIRPYACELEPGILAVLHAAFGPGWGDQNHWRWKHVSRPEFVPADVTLFTDAQRVVGVFHVAVRPLHLGDGVTVISTAEGDFAVQPGWRGGNFTQKAFLRSAPNLVERGVAVRTGFSSQQLHHGLYNPKFGHCIMPTVNAQYRKILSDEMLRRKLQELGERWRHHSRWKRLLQIRDLTVEVQVTGFKPCFLTFTRDFARCNPAASEPPQLVVRLPYELLAAVRMGRRATMLSLARAAFLGQVRTSGLGRLMVRYCTLRW